MLFRFGISLIFQLQRCTPGVPLLITQLELNTLSWNGAAELSWAKFGMTSQAPINLRLSKSSSSSTKRLSPLDSPCTEACIMQGISQKFCPANSLILIRKWMTQFIQSLRLDLLRTGHSSMTAEMP